MIQPRSNDPVKPITTVRVGGLALVFGAIAFVAVFSFLAPLWMIVFGVVLLRHRLPDPQVAGA